MDACRSQAATRVPSRTLPQDQAERDEGELLMLHCTNARFRFMTAQLIVVAGTFSGAMNMPRLCIAIVLVSLAGAAQAAGSSGFPSGGKCTGFCPATDTIKPVPKPHR